MTYIKEKKKHRYYKISESMSIGSFEGKTDEIKKLQEYEKKYPGSFGFSNEHLNKMWDDACHDNHGFTDSEVDEFLRTNI